ncbi:MAG: hypothetical protein ACREBG_01525 [Pyrinomonadaceae bacterium]
MTKSTKLICNLPPLYTNSLASVVSSVRVLQQKWKGDSMKKGEGSTVDEMRTEYKRSDFKKLERGKFYEKVVASSNVVVLEPRVAKAFRNSARVNQALSSLLELAQQSSRPTPRSTRTRAKAARAG